MAVFTKISEQQLAGFLQRYFPDFVINRFDGIEGGIENSNYFLDVQLKGVSTQWVLTLVEMDNVADLYAINKLTQYLASKSLPVPAPINDRYGKNVQKLAGKPGLLVPKMPGSHISFPSAGDCQRIGSFLGQMHTTTGSLETEIPLGRDASWLTNCWDTLNATKNSSLNQIDRELLRNEIEEFRQLESVFVNCPKGWTHGDLFVDNALFDNGSLSGVIDFYHACEDHLIIDLAIACNDWCYRLGQGYDSELMNALLAGYQKHRCFVAGEYKLWPMALRLGALRFWLSRLVSKHTNTYQSAARQGKTLKDPQEMEQKLIDAKKMLPLT